VANYKQSLVVDDEPAPVKEKRRIFGYGYDYHSGNTVKRN
jgi:hypothetical protein